MIRLDENTRYDDLLRNLMANSGIGTADLAKATGFRQDQISMWRWGKRVPGPASLTRLAGALGYELTLTPKPAGDATQPAPEPERLLTGCPATASGLCLSMAEGYALCEPDECVHDESGQRAASHPARLAEEA